MSSLIFQTASRMLQPLMLFVSVFLLLRGHHHPGGGFVGGLVAAAAYELQAMAFGVPAARATLRIDLRTIIGVGLASAVVTAALPLALGEPLFTALWLRAAWGGVTVELGTPLVFDLGVYLVVAAAASSFLFTLEEG
ncbi:Na+/H+ antiporter subunit B [Myxococcota bacterium]|nr:Na+/H+ antiporter subunit B [Myxococcota bacterium]